MSNLAEMLLNANLGLINSSCSLGVMARRLLVANIAGGESCEQCSKKAECEYDRLQEEMKKMDLAKGIDNLRSDLDNGGIKEDSSAIIMYIALANQAKKVLKFSPGDATAEEFLNLCQESGSPSLKLVATP